MLPDALAAVTDIGLNVVMPFLNGFIFELLLCAGLFVWKSQKRPGFALRACAMVSATVAVAAGTYVWFHFPSYMQLYRAAASLPAAASDMSASHRYASVMLPIVRFIVLYALCYLTIRMCFVIGRRLAVFYTAAAVAMQHFVYCLALIVARMLPDPWSDAQQWQGKVAFFVLSMMTTFLGYRVFVRPLERLPEQMAGHGVLLLFVGLLLCVNVFSCLFATFQGLPDGVTTLIMLTRLVTCAFVLALLAVIAGRESAERDGAVLRSLLSQQQSQLAADKETIDLINIKTHDLKKQLTMLGGRISQEEIDELNGLVGIYDSAVRTGNEALDVLLANRSRICEQRGIRFERMIDGSRIGFMKPADIYALFGNALDNAMEAVSAIDDPDRRYIDMSVCEQKGMLLIHVENPYEADLLFDDGLPRTTKSDHRYHGFGMRSMRMIAQQYDGVLTVDAADGVFSVDILLPLQ
ncbi:ATP-binding protein [Bifidobacterium eulemuris]|uniref:GHKL domain-containing protein n=1 Tax=Bifidobacterium eulemuris TaxID=1765219 RepID=A0A261G1F7_9BIFI|nr:ATP-binding protein [Bifidobacterium eulemuris]OZG65274.1 GHKL domain-containing protein [Bifidobacterium eulemuris]QOL32311.1 sensor histidine kinase [Bifidobacterium eulemuris]